MLWWASSNKTRGPFDGYAGFETLVSKPESTLSPEAQEATIAELKSTVAQQQKGMEALTAQVQKVSAQIEVNKPAPQLTANNE